MNVRKDEDLLTQEHMSGTKTNDVLPTPAP